MKDPARWLLGVTGFGTLGSGIVATFMHEAAAADVALIAIGGGLGAIASLLPVLASFKVDKSGIEAKFRDAEKDIAKGNVVDADKAVEAVETVLNPASATVTVNPSVKLDGVVTPGNVVMTPDAIASLTRLSSEDRAEVEAALKTLGTDPEDGTIVHSGRNAPRDYLAHEVNDYVWIYYRPLDNAAPEQWAGRALEKYVVVDIDTAP